MIPANAKFVKLPLAAQDYSAQVAQATDGTDCIYGGIADSNWAAFLPAFKSAGATQRLYGLQGNLNGKIAEAFPKETEGGIVVNSYPNIAGDDVDDYRAALEKYKAPDLDWNSLAGLGHLGRLTASPDRREDDEIGQGLHRRRQQDVEARHRRHDPGHRPQQAVDRFDAASRGSSTAPSPAT